ncbi:unnamed protein product, partial [Urochloa humidicola]
SATRLLLTRVPVVNPRKWRSPSSTSYAHPPIAAPCHAAAATQDMALHSAVGGAPSAAGPSGVLVQAHPWMLVPLLAAPWMLFNCLSFFF